MSSEGVILVALEDSALTANGESITMRRGDFKQIHGTAKLLIGSQAQPASHLVVIKIAAVRQPLTIEQFKLKSAEELDDASASNTRLVLALSRLQLQDTRNIGDESEWHSSKPRTIVLERGQTRWLGPGTHHLRNSEVGPAQFLTIEW